MSFDPEKVERLEFWANSDEGGMEPSPNGEWVHASDYDQLLALYREAVSLPPVYCKCGHHPDGHCGPNGACTSSRQIDKAHPNEWEHCACEQFATP